MTVKLLIKPKKILSDGRVNIYLSLRLPRADQSLLATGKRCFPSDWDEQQRLVKFSAPNAVLLNNYLRTQIQALESIILDRQRNGMPLSYQGVYGQYKGEAQGATTDHVAVVAYIEEKMQQIRLQVAKKTYEDYGFGLSQLRAYCPDVSFEQINTDWLRAYEAFQRHKGRKPNGIFRDFSVLRKFWNMARKEGLVKHYPFEDFKMPKEEVSREFLMPLELDALDHFFSEQGQTLPTGAFRTLGFFLFSCYTGLAHDDVLKRGDWQWLEDKLIIRRGKTRRSGKLTTIPLSSRAKRLIDHVQTHAIKQKKARIREDLDRIASKAGIDKHLTYHTARHTFAVNSLMRGINIKVIQQVLGHSSVRTTEVYLRIVDDYLEQEMLKWEDDNPSRD